jgi:hypothetical protein
LTTDAALIERREYKYLVDRPTAEAVRAAIRPFCRPDPYALRSPDLQYTVETLYLDTPDLALYWANDHEDPDRVKIRVRGYAEARAAPVFFEVKHRVGDVISKSRGRVGRESWADLVMDRRTRIPGDVRGYDRAHVERFLALARTKHARPITVVRYRREPWVSTVDDYARICFDTRIEAAAVRDATFDPPRTSWRALDGAVDSYAALQSPTVLELKFTTSVPSWLSNIVRAVGLYRGAFSKFGTSIEAFFAPGGGRTARVGGWE